MLVVTYFVKLVPLRRLKRSTARLMMTSRVERVVLFQSITCQTSHSSSLLSTREVCTVIHNMTQLVTLPRGLHSKDERVSHARYEDNKSMFSDASSSSSFTHFSLQNNWEKLLNLNLIIHETELCVIHYIDEFNYKLRHAQCYLYNHCCFKFLAKNQWT